LLAILAIAGLLYTWRLGASGYSTYYASAAKSMASSWRAMAFGALDPSASWTLDKLSGFVVPEALAVKLFGFHAWAIDLPQVLEGLVTIAVSFLIGSRWRGPAVGLAVAGVMATTPLLAAMFGHPTEDALLTMAMVLAFWAWQRALTSGHLGWLIFAGFWVAVGFQAKMLQAWLIVPALLLGFVVGAAGPVRARLWRAVVAGTAAALLSISWAGAIQLVPPADRPYIDGTTNNNTFSMVFGYNGADRILPGLIPGSVPQLAAHSSSDGSGSGTATQSDGHSAAKLVLPEFTTQIGWLYPSAAWGAVIELAAFARRRRTPDAATAAPDRVDLAVPLTAVLWLLLTAAVLAAAFVPHASYFGVIALPLALLAVGGARHALLRFRRPGTGRGRLLLPALGAAQTGWAAWIALTSPPSTRTLVLPLLAVGVIGVLLAGFAARRRFDHRLARIAIVALVVGALLGPAVWSSFVLGPGGAGSASDAYAGPRHVSAPPPRARPSTLRIPAPLNGPAQPVVDYVDSHGVTGTLFATDVLAIAVAVNLDSGREVEPMGGFSRQAPWPTADHVRAEISAQRLRYVLLDAPSASAPTNPTLDETRSWVRDHCRPVLRGAFRDGSLTRQTLYDCAG
jgi:4-amino-4-deoxy-L-arabinose transferase-like glycosyltransferase